MMCVVADWEATVSSDDAKKSTQEVGDLDCFKNSIVSWNIDQLLHHLHAVSDAVHFQHTPTAWCE